MWKIKKIIGKGDYKYALVPEHPNSTKNGYVLLHRIVVENHLGRLLSPNEIVHHKNHNKFDNRIENLEVLTQKEHGKLHSMTKVRKMYKLKCPCCSKIFYRRGNYVDFRLKRGHILYCSRVCSGSMSREIQLHGVTHEMESAISENILSSFYISGEDNSEETNL